MPIPIASGYNLDLYCKVCDGLKHSFREGYRIAEYYADGPRCYHIVRKQARRDGWILHKDGYATCPRCNPKSNHFTTNNFND